MSGGRSSSPVGALHAGCQRAGPREGEDVAGRRDHLRPRGRCRPRRQTRGSRPRMRRGRVRRVRQPRADDQGATVSTASGMPTTCGPRPRPGPTPSSCRRSRPPSDVGKVEKELEAAGAPDHTAIWAMVETPEAVHAGEGDRFRFGAAHRPRDGHERPREGTAGRARARPGAARPRPRHVRHGRPGSRAR